MAGHETIAITPLEECTLMSGGMGVNVLSADGLGKVAAHGMAATASITAADIVSGRMLMRGNKDFLRAVQAFPKQSIAEGFIDRYWHPDGVSMEDDRKVLYPVMPITKITPHEARLSTEENQTAIDNKVIGGFVLTWLAIEAAEKEARNKGMRRAPIGINALYKILDGVGSYYGAMLAGADYIAMGAGMPTQVPGLLRQLAEGQSVEYLAKITGGKKASDYSMPFDPGRYRTGQTQDPSPMDFLLIATTHQQVAGFMHGRDKRDIPYGYVMENHFAGGHNAPPMGGKTPAPGEPYTYSERDKLDIAAMNALGVRYWLAGDQTSPQKLAQAREQGALGVQIGSIMALSDESNFVRGLRQAIVAAIHSGKPHEVFASPTTSPSGYPFNVVMLPGTVAFREVSDRRTKACDVGKLIEITETNGKFTDRCPAGSEQAWERAGGTPFRLKGQNCLCNSLLAAIGLGQARRKNGKILHEPAEISLGSGETVNLAVEALTANYREKGRKVPGYSVQDVINYMSVA